MPFKTYLSIWENRHCTWQCPSGGAEYLYGGRGEQTASAESWSLPAAVCETPPRSHFRPKRLGLIHVHLNCCPLHLLAVFILYALQLRKLKKPKIIKFSKRTFENLNTSMLVENLCSCKLNDEFEVWMEKNSTVA